MPEWTRLSNENLARLMFTEADQLPMGFAREVIGRGPGMIPLLAEVVRDARNWDRIDAGWCAVVHATYLLGAIGGDAAIEPLMDALRLAEAFEEDWVVPELPAIFSRLGPKALDPLRYSAVIPGDDWMLRHTALSCMAAITIRCPEEEKDVFKVIAIIAEDEREDDAIRVWAGKLLLDFGRAECRDILLRLVDSGMAKPLYGRREVRRGLRWPNVASYCRDWLKFYEAEQVLKRRRDAERKRLSMRRAWDEALAAPWGKDPDADEEDSPEDPCDGAANAAADPMDWLDKEPEGRVGRA